MALVDDGYHQNTVELSERTREFRLHRNCGWAAFLLLVWVMGLRRQEDVCFVLLLGLL